LETVALGRGWTGQSQCSSSGSKLKKATACGGWMRAACGEGGRGWS